VRLTLFKEMQLVQTSAFLYNIPEDHAHSVKIYNSLIHMHIVKYLNLGQAVRSSKKISDIR